MPVDASTGGAAADFVAPDSGNRYNVTFVSDSGLVVLALAGDSPPVLTGGVGGWEVVDRPKRVAITRFGGQQPYRQDVSILFDGWLDSASIENDIETLRLMGRQPGDIQEPPKIKVSGLVERPDLTWVIDDLTQNTENVIWDYEGGSRFRRRQGFVVHLLEYVDDTIISTPARPQLAGKVIDGAGKTPRQLAQEQYGSPDFWTIFLSANAWMNDPRKPVPAGTQVIVPPKPKTIPHGA